MFKRNLLCFIFPLCLLFCHWTPLKKSRSVFFVPSLQVFISTGQFPLSLLFWGWTVPSLSASPLIIFCALHWAFSSPSVSTLYWGIIADHKVSLLKCVKDSFKADFCSQYSLTSILYADMKYFLSRTTVRIFIKPKLVS